MRKKQIPILVAILALVGVNMMPASVGGVKRALAMAAAAAIAYEVTDYLMEKRGELAQRRAARSAKTEASSRNGASHGVAAEEAEPFRSASTVEESRLSESAIESLPSAKPGDSTGRAAPAPPPGAPSAPGKAKRSRRKRSRRR